MSEAITISGLLGWVRTDGLALTIILLILRSIFRRFPKRKGVSNFVSGITSMTGAVEEIKTMKPLIYDMLTVMKEINKNVGKEKLSKKNSILIFKSFLHTHCDRKLDFAKEILIENSIHIRRAIIEENLRTEFVRITHEEASNLSEYNAGGLDMGQLLLTLDVDEFMKEIYAVFFREDKGDHDKVIRKKIIDMRSVMTRRINGFVKFLEDNIRD